jgi:hypothetical protein
VGRTLEDLARIVGHRVPEGPRGFFLGGRHSIVIMEPRNRSEAYVLIAHETTHLLTAEIPEIISLGIPPWFFEGIAIHVSEQERLRREIRVASLLEGAAALAREGLIIDPVDPGDLMSWASGRITDMKVIGATMAQGYHMVIWIVNEYGERVLRELLGSFQERRTFPEALKAVTGSDLGEITEKWKKTLPRC